MNKGPPCGALFHLEARVNELNHVQQIALAIWTPEGRPEGVRIGLSRSESILPHTLSQSLEINPRSLFMLGLAEEGGLGSLESARRVSAGSQPTRATAAQSAEGENLPLSAKARRIEITLIDKVAAKCPRQRFGRRLARRAAGPKIGLIRSELMLPPLPRTTESLHGALFDLAVRPRGIGLHARRIGETPIWTYAARRENECQGCPRTRALQF